MRPPFNEDTNPPRPKSVLSALAAVVLFLAAPRVHASAELQILTTTHYRVHTDLDSSFAHDLTQRLEGMFDQYARRLSIFNPRTTGPFEVYLFQRRIDYEKLTKDRLQNTGGIFMPGENLLAAYLELQGRDGLRRTLQHEAFHQFAYASFGDRLPVWLNEGIAQVFEEGIWSEAQFSLGQVSPRRIRQLAADLGGTHFIEVQSFMSLDHAAWAFELRDPVLGAARYDQAWAMTHFLIFCTDESGRFIYRTRLIEMLQEIARGAAGDDAFVRAFSANYSGFQTLFLQYAAQLQPTPEASALENQAILADLFIALTAHDRPFSDVGDFRRKLVARGARLRYSHLGGDWTTSADPLTYFRDPTGRIMDSDRLFLSMRGGAPLPDIVCQPVPGLQLRTIFHDSSDKPDHETIVESH